MPILSPATPQFTTNSERAVWKALRAQLRDDDLLVASQRITDRGKDHEIDFVVVFADAGVVAVEVKGSQVWRSRAVRCGSTTASGARRCAASRGRSTPSTRFATPSTHCAPTSSGTVDGRVVRASGGRMRW